MKANFISIQHPELTIRLRPAQEEEAEFLYRVYASTRSEELLSYGWDTGRIETFLRFQFETRSEVYRRQYPDAENYVILDEDTPIGLFTSQISEKEIRGIDIALLPAWRSRGIGTAIIERCFSWAREHSVPFRIHVEKQNTQALKLYERLGFKPIGGDDVYLAMEWRASN